MKKPSRNDHSKTAWTALVRALRKRDIISSTEVTRLAKQYTDVSPDYALRRLQRKGVLQRLKNGPRGLYVVADGKNGKFITDPIEAVQVVCGKEVVERACGEIDRSASAFLPNHKPGEATITGADFPIPLTILVGTPITKPTSDRPNYKQYWKSVAQEDERLS